MSENVFLHGKVWNTLTLTNYRQWITESQKRRAGETLLSNLWTQRKGAERKHFNTTLPTSPAHLFLQHHGRATQREKTLWDVCELEKCASKNHKHVAGLFSQSHQGGCNQLLRDLRTTSWSGCTAHYRGVFFSFLRLNLLILSPHPLTQLQSCLLGRRKAQHGQDKVKVFLFKKSPASKVDKITMVQIHLRCLLQHRYYNPNNWPMMQCSGLRLSQQAGEKDCS